MASASPPVPTPPVAGFGPAPPLTELADRVANGELLVCWDPPELALTPGDQLVAPLIVSGWAHARDGIVAVWISIDDTTWVQAVHNQWRPDLVRALQTREAMHGGFRAVLTPSELPPGRHDVAVIAVDGLGRAAGVRGTVEIAATRNQGGPQDAADPSLPRPVVPLDGNGERFVPELHTSATIEAEHQTRYQWACALAAGRTVLDAGCGVGWGSALLLEAGAASVTGLDLSELALESARERTAGRATLVRGDLQAPPFKDDSFDLVVCFEAIEHVEDPEQALDELRRVLRPDGILLISSPNRGVYPTGNPFHLHEYTSQELEDTLRNRFANVVPYRQQTHVGSLLVADADFAITDPGTPLAADVRKTVGGEPGDELYTVVACSDGPVPELHGVAALTAAADIKAWIETTIALERRALLAEADYANVNAAHGLLTFEHEKTLVALQAADHARRAAEHACQAAEARGAELEAEYETLRRQREEAERWLAGHRASLSWRITAPLRAAKRARAPRKGR